MKSNVWPILAACAIAAPSLLAQPDVGPRQHRGPAPQAERPGVPRDPSDERPNDRVRRGQQFTQPSQQGRFTPPHVAGPRCDCDCHNHDAPPHSRPHATRGFEGRAPFDARGHFRGPDTFGPNNFGPDNFGRRDFDMLRERLEDRRERVRDLMRQREAFERGFELGRQSAFHGRLAPPHPALGGIRPQSQRPSAPPDRARSDDDRSQGGVPPELRDRLRQRFGGDIPPEAIERLHQRLGEQAVPLPRGPRSDEPRGSGDDRRPRMNDRPQDAPPRESDAQQERQPPRRRPL